MQDECDSKALIKEKKTSTARRRIVSSTKWRVIEADPKERVAHDGVCHGVCDETRDSVTELIMTGRGRWHRVSALIWCPGMMNTILIISVRVSTHNTPSEVSKQFASNSLCLASVVAVEDWWLLLLIEYNIKCRQSMRVCIPVVRRLQCYTGHTKTRLTLITRTVQASLNAKWTYPLFIQPAIVRGIVFVCLSNSHSTPFDLVYHVTCVLIFPVSSKIKAVRGLGVMGRRVLGGRGWGSHSGDIYCYGTICTKARQSIRMKHIRLIGIATPSTAAQYWK